jgi:hypothetical protein
MELGNHCQQESQMIRTVVLQLRVPSSEIINNHQVLQRLRAAGSCVIIATSQAVCSSRSSRVAPRRWQYGIPCRLANNDQTREIGGNSKVYYPSSSDTPGIALLSVRSLNSRAQAKAYKATSSKETGPYP